VTQNETLRKRFLTSGKQYVAWEKCGYYRGISSTGTGFISWLKFDFTLLPFCGARYRDENWFPANEMVFAKEFGAASFSNFDSIKIDFLLRRNKFEIENSFDMKEQISMVLNFDFDNWASLGLGDSEHFRWRLLLGSNRRPELINSHYFSKGLGSSSISAEVLNKFLCPNVSLVADIFRRHFVRDFLHVHIVGRSHSHISNPMFSFYMSWIVIDEYFWPLQAFSVYLHQFSKLLGRRVSRL